MTRNKWPNGKTFAFTIVDDTDNGTVKNVEPVYRLLEELGLLTTKTVWVYPPRDRFTGECLQDENYLDLIKDLKAKGFEIALHNVGSGSYSREEIFTGLDLYKKLLGEFPSMHINHAQNPDNIYFGIRGGSKLLQLYSKFRSPKDKYYGEVESSRYFWGDWFKKHIKFTRGRTYTDINTLKQDPLMPYIDRNKEKYSNYWFSSSDGNDVNHFKQLINKDNVDRLEQEGGLCIVYTHFAEGFVNENGVVDPEFRKSLKYLASKNGWFVPAGEVLEYLLSKKKNHYSNEWYSTFQDIRNIIRIKISRFRK